jgi:hypothetical protein
MALSITDRMDGSLSTSTICLWGNMRTLLPTAIVVAIAATFLVSQVSQKPPAATAEVSIVDKLQNIVTQSLIANDTQANALQWQDLRAEGSAAQIMTFLSENPSSPHKEEAMAHLQGLLNDEIVTQGTLDLLAVAPDTQNASK